MRVLIVNTSEKTGGAAIAAGRLCHALNDHGVKTKMLVRDKETERITVAQVGTILPKIAERASIWLKNRFSKKNLWQIDLANTGIDITKTEEFREADVIHLHWVNQGMLSLNTLRKIINSGKKVVWTLHDEWPYLGVCHYRGDCKEQECRHCPLMRGNTPNRLLREKQEIYRSGHITFVGCSEWITSQAQKAMPGEHVVHIPNCIPSDTFHPIDKKEARKAMHLPADKKIVLFCSQKVTDERKGMKYLDEAIKQLPDVEVVRIGGGGIYISDPKKMAQLYSAADCFVTPSLQDNLPNTIAEAMSCGTPCVGFRVGGIPEMINHKVDGYLAEYCDSNSLAEGIRYVLDHQELREAAHRHAQHLFSEEHVATEYIKVYEK